MRSVAADCVATDQSHVNDDTETQRDGALVSQRRDTPARRAGLSATKNAVGGGRGGFVGGSGMSVPPLIMAAYCLLGAPSSAIADRPHFQSSDREVWRVLHHI